MSCSICSSPMSESAQELFALPTVTSDCRPYKPGRSVEICSGCGVMRRVTNADFSDVYDNYVSYPEPTGRTAKILDFVKHRVLEPETILDIGTGIGGGLKVLMDKFPNASIIEGYDPYSEEFKDKPDGKFDFITLFHVLEHVEDLHEMLACIKSSLTDNGHVLIQVPYTAMWPFDLIVADHWWHFNHKSLIDVLDNSGFTACPIRSHGINNPIQKELTVLATKGCRKYTDFTPIESAKPISWLLSYKKFLDAVNEPVAVMGTGPAAAWVGNILGNKTQYYIDDDSNRYVPFNGKAVYPTSWCKFPVVAPFPDWQSPAIKVNHPNLRFL